MCPLHTWWAKARNEHEQVRGSFVFSTLFLQFACCQFVHLAVHLQELFSAMCMGRSSLVRTFFEFGRLKVRSFELTRRGGSSGKLPFWGGYLAFFGHLEPNLAFFAPSEGQKAHVCLVELFASLSVSEFDSPVRPFWGSLAGTLFEFGGPKVRWFELFAVFWSKLVKLVKLGRFVP